MKISTRKNAIFCFALALSTAALPAHAQEANSRAGFYLGFQPIFSTPFSTNEHMTANTNGMDIYAEKIWKNNNAVRVRYAFMASKDFIGKTHNWMGDEVLFRDKLSYDGGIVDYLRYFDNKFVPHVFAGIGIFSPHWMDKGGHYSGLQSTQPSASFGLYYGIGWDFFVSSQRVAIEFNIRNSGGSKEGSSFEASFCLPLKFK